jgi:hypothetical protein
MRGNIKRRLAAVAAVALGVSGGLLIATQGSAAGGPKAYTAAVTPGTPTKLKQTAQTVSITLSNTSRNSIAFNAVNLAVPTGVTVIGPSLVGSSVGSAEFLNGVIQLRGLNTPKDSSVTVTFSASAVAQTTCTGYVFVSDVRQSNDFNGQNNQFVRSGADATFTGPCSSSTVHCVADNGGSPLCSTGVVQSNNGNTAEVILNDGDSVTADLTASVANGALNCSFAGYTPTSDQLSFGITNVTAGVITSLTKTVSFSQLRPISDARLDWQYQVCFEAPYDFPALRLDGDQLTHDFALGNFSGNTMPGSAPGSHKGLLLPCSAGYITNPFNGGQPSPCLLSVTITPVDASNNLVSIVVTAPAADPGMRF